jgi:hypothetical protein
MFVLFFSFHSLFSKEFAMNPTRLWAPLLVLALITPLRAVVVDFEDFSAGSFGVGGSFSSAGISFDVIAYNGVGSQVSISKTGNPVNTRLFSGNSVGVNVDLPANTNLISFDFGDFCGGCSTTGITINGVASSPTVQLTALDNTTLGGATIDVVLGVATTHQMILTGPITTFAIGGTELAIDNLRLAVPEPSGFVLLVGLAGLVFRRRQ